MTTDYLAEAYAAMPDYAESIAALRRVDAFRPASPQDSFDLSNGVHEIVAAADAGADMPTSIGQRVLDSRRAREHASIELQALSTARQHLTDRQETAARSGVDHGLLALRTHLDRVLAEARTLAVALRAIPDAQSALDAGSDTAAAWQRFGDLATEHQAIRAAQTTLLRLHYRGDSSTVDIGHHTVRHVAFAQVLGASGWIANLDMVWPAWRPAPGAAGGPAWEGWTTPSTAPPWPHHDHRDPLAAIHNREYLMWLVTSDAEPWLPTLREMVRNFAGQLTAADERHAAADPPPAPSAPIRVSADRMDDHLAAHRSIEASRI